MEPIITIATLLFLGKIVGAITALSTALFGVFKVINWIKAKFVSIDDNVVKLKDSMDVHITGLRDDIKEQTKTISNALSEQRQDFRMLYAPTLLMLQQTQQFGPAPVRAKKPVRRKK